MRHIQETLTWSVALSLLFILTGCLEADLAGRTDAWGLDSGPSPEVTEQSQCRQDACPIGERKCVGAQVYSECVDNGSGCGVWNPGEGCPLGTMCRAGRCAGADGVSMPEAESSDTDTGTTTGPDSANCDDDDSDGFFAQEGCGSKVDCNDKARDINPGAEEKCDQKDNNCDGDIDEGCGCKDGKTRECYSGMAGTKGVGVCTAGTQTCTNMVWGGCKGEVRPMLEKCNGMDDDCDGQVDESFMKAGQPCDGGDSDQCKNGTWQCKSSSGTITCGAESKTDIKEVCDGRDNDCDGQTDEGLEGGSCSTGKPGICGDGVRQCSSGGSQCVQQNTPTWEHCNGKDDDCDGKNDAQEGTCASWPDCHRSDPNFNNCCHYGPSTPGVLPTFPGGFCDPDGDGGFEDANWQLGHSCYQQQC